MTGLRFVGDLPLWFGLLLALLVAVMAWRYYRRESFDLPHRLRWILPGLRSLAFFLGIMVLTGPVLHHRTTIGEPGRVKIYVDASQSMALLDRHVSSGRKLLIAEQQGWLEAGRVDTGRLDQADQLARVGNATIAGLQSDSIGADDVVELRDTLLASVQSVLADNGPSADGISDAMPSAAESALNGIVRQLKAVSVADSSSLDIAVSRMTAVCEQMLPVEQQLRTEFEDDARRFIDAGDESVAAALAMFDETPRWRRAERSLLETETPLFDELKKEHNVEVFALQNQKAVELIDGLAMEQAPLQLAETPDAATTDLTTGITNSQKLLMRSEETERSDEAAVAGGASTAVVLLTDGRHNSGPSPLQTARVLGGQGISLFPVSLGATRHAPDLAVTGLEHPQMVFQKDRVRGTMIVRDRMPIGQPMMAQVEYDGEIVWQEQLLTQDTGERRIDFEFGIEELVEKLDGQFDSEVSHHAVAIEMTASVTPLADEAETQNNQLPLRFAAVTQSYRMLIIDGRSRWETRYLRNAFERDTQWDVSVVIAGPGTDDEALPRGDRDDQFPKTRDDLFGYDIILFGEVAPELFQDHEFTWLREFVEIRGGGLVFVDGQRGHMRNFTERDLGPLLPVEWSETAISAIPAMLQLTEKGKRLSALTFETEQQANEQFWNELPVPHTLNAVKAVPGAEVLVEAVVDGTLWPAMVTRNYGSGRILYQAFDETWRWRYKAADTYHQRIWNQLAKYVMPRPFSASDEYLAVDTGPVSYKNGDVAQIRVRLKGLDGKPVGDSTVDALLWMDDRIVSTVNLAADPDVPGMYRGNSAALDRGEYEVSVRASGFSQEALKARGSFVVLPPETGELEETACNEDLLQQMAAESGGTYLREEQLGRLSEILSPFSSGRIVESDTVLWQSYWWFAAIVMLLSLEWFLRKRAGLL